MITRFDHAVIAVGDLDEAIRRYQALGFDVRPGGRHVGLGTYNALIRFGLDYLELLSVSNEAEAAAGGLAIETLVDFLRKREGGLLGYALATSNMEQEAEYLHHSEFPSEPLGMQRMRPDGNLLKWRLLFPGNVPWRRPWPFLIQWDTPDAQRLTWEGPGTHPNGVTGWVGITIVVRDLERMTDLYTHLLGLSMEPGSRATHLNTQQASFQLGSSRIDLLKPTGAGPVQQMLEEVGEGPFEITLAVKNLDQARKYLTRVGIPLEPYLADSARAVLPPEHTLGAHLVLKEEA
ncbi:MAG TPA: VOC family protein [Ktedonobacteraceae bacterium]|nr:VOC family protein [Ktedonobacteraceae bacterium]